MYDDLFHSHHDHFYCGCWRYDIDVVKSIRDRTKNRIKVALTSIGCICLAAAAWILNPEWLRVIMTLLPIPLIHTAIFFAVNFFISSYVDKSQK